jgi:Tol biopolymer transport system component
LGNAGIIRLAADGSEALSLTPTSSGEHHRARWSPDGKMIAFTKHDNDGSFRPSLYLMNTSGLAVEKVPLPDSLLLTGSVDWIP